MKSLTSIFCRPRWFAGFLAPAFLVLLLFPSSDAPGFGLGDLVEGAKKMQSFGSNPSIPGLNNILKRQPALYSSNEDAYLQISILDGWNPKQPISMAGLPSSNGKYRLRPGTYELNAKSYCLGIGMRFAGRGNGYVAARMNGKLKEIISSILRNSMKYPEIPQGEIQVFLWAVLAQAKIKDLSKRYQAIARKLLSRRQIFQLNGGALGLIPKELRDKALAKLPPKLKKIIAAETEIRELVTKAQYNYRQLEKIAVPSGKYRKPRDGMNVPYGRWSLHPKGYFIRYLPALYYSKSKIQVVVPKRYSIKRDDLGRIVLMKNDEGFSIETVYDDSLPPKRADKLGLTAYPFRLIRMTKRRVGKSGKLETLEIRNKGWVFVHTSNRDKRRADAGVVEGWRPVLLASLDTPGQPLLFAGRTWTTILKKSYDQAGEVEERYNYFSGLRDRMGRTPGPEAIDRLGDIEHYRDGIKAAMTGDVGGMLEWIIENRLRQNEALMYATALLDTLPTSPDADVDLSDTVALPNGGQALGMSGSPRL